MMHSGWWSYISVDNKRPQPKITRAVLRRVMGYARPHLRSIAIVLVMIVTVSLLELIPPLLYRELIDHVLPNRDFNRLNWLAVGMLGIPLVTGLLNVIQRRYSALAGEGIIYDLRTQMYAHLQRMSVRFFTHTKSGDIISRFNNDVIGAQNAITGTVPNLVTNIVTLVSTAIIMATIEWRLALLALVALPFFLLPARRVGRVLRDIRRQAMEHNADMSNRVTETLSINGAILVKTFGSHLRERVRFDSSNAAVRDIGVRRAQIGQIYFWGMSVATTIGTALIYWVGGYLVLNDAITIGTIVAFAAYLGRLYGPINSLAGVHIDFAQSLVSFERVFEYLDLPVEIQSRPNAVTFDKVRGDIQFDRVWFKYEVPDLDLPEPEAGTAAGDVGGAAPTQPTNGNRNGDKAAAATGPIIVPTRQWALEDVSFSVAPGELLALVGPSGAGKTTTTYLMPRLYDPTEGAIYLDGVDLRDADPESLARQVGMVTQESYLFHDTIRANLVYAKPDAGQDEIDAACRAANIYDFIMGLPLGYDTVVGERGYRLSGGEKQRLAIARVILKDPRILVLDEATSHLDSQNEALIQAALEPLFAGRTSIVIAHRLSTVLAADKILVVDQGRIVERGTHLELLALGGLYTRLYETQIRDQAQRVKADPPNSADVAQTVTA
jgi:ATP-binding cassette subfamily B protein